MDKFTWIPFYKEIAEKLKAYRDRQSELIQIIKDLQSREIPVISLIDKDADDNPIPLTEIDPFTFFGNFNRGITNENRLSILTALKERFGLLSQLPSDFDGIPLVNNQQAWFFAYKRNRGNQDIRMLWELFIQATEDRIDPNTFDTVRHQRCVKYNITMGLFWIAPERYLNLDSINRQYLAKHGINVTELQNYQSYVDYMQKTKNVFSKPFYEISYDAWVGDSSPLINPDVSKQSLDNKRYWIYAPGERARLWEEYAEQGLIGIGWNELKEDLTQYTTEQDLRKRYYEVYDKDGTQIDFNQVWSFVHEMKQGDIVFVKRGVKELVGFGVIDSDYFYDSAPSEYRHLRSAKWLTKGSWAIPDTMKNLPVKTLTELREPERIQQLIALVQNQDVPGEVIPFDTAKMQYWWLNANPKIWDIVDAAIGSRQTYTSYNAQGNKRRIYQYFSQVKPGDILLGYVASPMRQIVALCKVTKGLHQSDEGEAFEFEKIDHFSNPISFKDLQAVPELAKCEPLINNQGSLFRVKADEFDIIRAMLDEGNERISTTNPSYDLEAVAQDTGFTKEQLAYWIAAINRKKQAILFGPPGTGKTFLAEHLASHMIADGDGFKACIQFHPAYSYEEFIQGYRPETDGKGGLQFDLKSGRFIEFCAEARKRKGPCVLIIDEINRANIARVFGELMYLLEYRNQSIPLAAGMRFSIPENVRIIGTMNTADRSIALVDFALRRRFAFLNLFPDYGILLKYQQSRGFNAEALIRVMRDINTLINDKNYHLGISFFLTDDLPAKMEGIWKLEIEPYLEEYFFSKPDSVTQFRWDGVKEKISL